MILPTSFSEEFMSEWSVWVLDHGLPDLPSRVEVGESVPIAYWSGPAVGAVLHRTCSWSDDDADDASVFDEVLLFRRTGGGWEEADGHGGSGGGTDAELRRPDGSLRSVGGGAITSAGNADWWCCSVEGLAGADVASVEVRDSSGITRRPIDSPVGAFIAATGDRVGATIVVRDVGGREVATAEFGELWTPLWSG